MTLLDYFNESINADWETGALDTQFSLTEKDGETFLKFQWSSSTSDWLNNFDFPVVPYKNTPVKWYAHRGFVRTWHAVRDTILERIRTTRVTVLGFSRGGGIAQLAHEDLEFHKLDVHTYTFGAPRVVWKPPKIIHDRFDGLINICAYGDIITHLPPKILGYSDLNRLVAGEKRPISAAAHYPENYQKVLG